MRCSKSPLLAAVAAWALSASAADSDTDFPGPEIGYVPSLSDSLQPGCIRLTDFWRFASRLSKNADVYYEGEDLFNTYTTRWSNVGTPTVNITILPATENDVSHIVRFANRCSIPFLAYNGRHGALTTLERMDWGIAIDLRKLSSVEILSGGTTAKIGGGTNSKVVVDALWEAGKQTVTGTCECVSYMGPALGGGHGWLQGHYGLVADQFVSLNIVLADGSLKTITPSSDLWWAMRGAGHNFGVVTSVTAKIYPKIHTTYAIETMMFTGDKVQAIYEATNSDILKDGKQPVDIINWSYWMNIPAINPNGPVIELYIIQENATTVDPAYTHALKALGPISSTPQSGSYKDVSAWTGVALDSPPCQNAGMANPRFPLYLEKYNPTAMASLYSAFQAATKSGSAFANSLFMFEGYSTQGVAAGSADSSAFAYRSDKLLVAPLIQYTPAGPERDAEAKALGSKLRNILHEGSNRSERHVYVNYAYGDEGKAEWYGHEKWRQDKLSTLKAKYDPHGRFSFYAPAA